MPAPVYKKGRPLPDPAMTRHTAPLVFATTLLVLSGCASMGQDEARSPLDLANCRVGGEKGPSVPGQPSSGRDRRCNPESEAVLWSSGSNSDMKLELPRRGA